MDAQQGPQNTPGSSGQSSGSAGKGQKRPDEVIVGTASDASSTDSDITIYRVKARRPPLSEREKTGLLLSESMAQKIFASEAFRNRPSFEDLLQVAESFGVVRDSEDDKEASPSLEPNVVDLASLMDEGHDAELGIRYDKVTNMVGLDVSELESEMSHHNVEEVASKASQIVRDLRQQASQGWTHRVPSFYVYNSAGILDYRVRRATVDAGAAVWMPPSDTMQPGEVFNALRDSVAKLVTNAEEGAQRQANDAVETSNAPAGSHDDKSKVSYSPPTESSSSLRPYRDDSFSISPDAFDQLIRGARDED